MSADAAIARPTRLAAEFIGTLLLLATVVGSGVMAERLADGNDAVALLANTLATAAALYVLISIFAPVSGAHFNPAVSMIVAPRRDMLPLIAVQIIAAVLGVLLTHLMFGVDVIQLGVKPRTGIGLWISECVATFGLVLTILLGGCYRPAAVPALVAAWITAAYWFTASTSFANPAVTLARALTDSFAGIRPSDAPAFIAAQLIGAFAARWVASRFALASCAEACPGLARPLLSQAGNN